MPLDFRNQDREHWEAEAERLRKKLAAPVPTVAPVPCPYPGIRPFTTEDAARIHGRDKEVKDLLGRLCDGQRGLYVIGPSGSGKSSLVAAGHRQRTQRLGYASPGLGKLDLAPIMPDRPRGRQKRSALRIRDIAMKIRGVSATGIVIVLDLTPYGRESACPPKAILSVGMSYLASCVAYGDGRRQ